MKQTPKEIFVCQSKFTKELIKVFGIKKKKAFGTPMSPSKNINFDTSRNSVNEKTYQGMIGSLLYLIASRPNIMFNVHKYVRFPSDPKELHLTIVKQII